MKRLLVLLLFVLLAIMPLATSQAAVPDDVRINGVSLTDNADTPYYKNGASTPFDTDHSAGWNAYYNSSEGVLTLRNLTVENSSATAEVEGRQCNYGIYAGGGANDSLTIKLEGNNSVSTAANTGNHCSAVYTTCNLTISGNGVLTATGGGRTVFCFGIYVDHTLTITGGTITAGARAAQVTGGLRAVNMSVSGGTVKGTGGTSDSSNSVSDGVYAASTITVSGGKLTGEGGSAHVSNGVRADTAIVMSGGRLEGKSESGGTEYWALNGTPITLPDPPCYYYWRISETDDYNNSPCNFDWSNFHTYADILVSRPSPGVSVSVPTFIAGQAPSNETVRIVSDDVFNATRNFDSASLGNTALDLGGEIGQQGAHGYVRNGSIIIGLHKAYLDTLPAGTYTLTVNLKGTGYAGQSVHADIHIVSPGAPTDVSAGIPETGDSAKPLLWLMIGLMSSAGLAVSAVSRRRAANRR